MRELELLLKALTAANLATPAIVAMIQSVKNGSTSGMTDDEILEHASTVALETRSITEADMSDNP